VPRRPEPSEVPTVEGSEPPRIIHPSLASIVSAFGFIGFTSFGGARAAYFRHAMVVSRRWLTDEQFLEGLTISQVLPGPNISNLSVYLGQRLRGLTGASFAVIAVLLPGTVMIVALAVAYFGHGNLPGLTAVFKGVGAAAVGLSLATTLQVGIKGVHRGRDWLVVLVTFLAVGFLHVSLLIPLLTIAPVSVWMNRPSRRATAPAGQAPPARDDAE
jgi:chromate transporter